MSNDNIYKAPQADLVAPPETDSAQLFFPSSQKKLIILFIATLGLYSVYWFYKNWQIHQNVMDDKVIPALRGFFYIFFTYSLFKRVADTADRKNISTPWGAGWLATVFILLTIVSNILDRISARTDGFGALDIASILILFVLIIPLYMVQDTINQINNDKDGASNSVFSFYNYIFIFLGAILWFFIAVGIFQPEIFME